MSKYIVYILFAGLFLTNEAYSHARFVNPPPRNLSSGIKTGPCGGLPRGQNVTTYQQGQVVEFEFIETIDHPGRYYISFSPAGDSGFVRWLEIPDIQGQPLPRTYRASFTIPQNLEPCTDCTIQLIQSMEENPERPSFYFSCSDVNIVASESPPPGGGGGNEGSQDLSSTIDEPLPAFGCGRVGSGHGRGPGPLSHMIIFFALMIFPLVSAYVVKVSLMTARR